MTSFTHPFRRTPAHIALGTFVAVLSMGVSHQAMAACTQTGTSVTCTGAGTTPGIAANSSTKTVTIDSGTTVYATGFTQVNGSTGTSIDMTTGQPTSGTARLGGIVLPQIFYFDEDSAVPPTFVTKTKEGEDVHGNEVDIVVGPGITVTNNGRIDNSNSVASNTNTFGVIFDGSNNTVVNNGTISMTTSGTATIYGVYTSVPTGENYYDNNHIINNGLIEVTRNGNGTARAIYFGEQQLGMTVDNNAGGILRGTRTGSSSGTNIVAAIDTDDTPGLLTVNNAAASGSKSAGVIEVTGARTSAIYGRSSQTIINNAGTIQNNSWVASDSISSGHYAIGSYAGSQFAADPDSPDEDNPIPLVVDGKGAIESASKLTVNNYSSGVIKGDVLAVDANPLTAYALGAGGFAQTNTSGQLTPTNANTRNSEINNWGKINGNIYLGSGAHEVTNFGEITQTIIVNQSATTICASTYGGSANASCTALGTLVPYTIQGARTFSFSNYGQFGTEVSGGAQNAVIRIMDFADSVNTIDLYGTGFKGSIIATNGTGDNTVNFHNDMSIASIQKFRSLGMNDAHVTGTNASGITLQNNATIATTIYGPGGSAVTPSTNLGHLSFSAGTLTLGGATTISPTTAWIVHSGDVFEVASSVTGGTVSATDTALVDWTATKAGSGKLLLSSEVKDAAQIDGMSSPGATTINALINQSGDSPVLNALGGAIQQLSNDADVARAGNQLAPETNFATQQAAITLNSAVGQHIDTRLAAVGGTGNYGQYASPSGLGMKPAQDPNRSNLGGSLKDDGGDEYVAPRSAALWGHAFGAGMDQNERQNVDGYDARLYGIIAGYDNWISPGFRVGVAGGYANTSIDGEGDTFGNRTTIDSYLIEAYGSFRGAGWYATGRTGFTWHDYETQRVIDVGPLNDVARANHDGRQFNASLEVGAPMHFARTIFTPIASLTYSNLDQDGYTETDNGSGVGLAINSQSNDSLVSALGVKAIVPIANDTVIEGRAAWLHEFLDSAQTVSAAFAAGGGTFTAAGPDVGRDTAALGAGLIAQINPGMNFEINYDANVRQDYLAHIGSARLTVGF